MQRLRPAVLTTILISLAGCSQPTPPAAESTPPSAAAADAPAVAPAPAPANDALNQAIQQPQDRARAVEDQLKDDAAKQREAIDAQGG